jgi:hypothetical protein
MEAQVREVLSRVLTDDAFLDQMLTNPEQALRPYDLTDEERSILASPNRDLLELVRIGGGRAPGFNIDVTVIIDITLDLSLDLTLDLELPEAARRQAVQNNQIASLATTVLAARSGADRLERIQQMLQVVSGATTLARRSSGQSRGENG